MPFPVDFARAFLFLFSFFVFFLFATEGQDLSSPIAILVGLFCAMTFSVLLATFELLAKKLRLKDFNTMILGSALGYLFAFIFSSSIDMVLQACHLSNGGMVVSGIKVAFLLFGLYFGITLTARALEEFHLHIPFVRLKTQAQKKKDLLVDLSLLSDPRLIDLANTGLLDNRLVIPGFLINELYSQMEQALDEGVRNKARGTLDAIKHLEMLPHLNLRHHEEDLPDIKDIVQKITNTARNINADIFTADANRLYPMTIDNLRIVNIHAVANALKPINPAGELLQIKIRRKGKEDCQGVGYLDDGTMVVVNGGGTFIDETVKAQVLSVKHTPSGRMIFCNAVTESFSERFAAQSTTTRLPSLETL